MSALTLIFLFISVVYMLQVNKEKERIEMIAKDFKNTKYEIYTDLNEEFKDDLKNGMLILIKILYLLLLKNLMYF